VAAASSSPGLSRRANGTVVPASESPQLSRRSSGTFAAVAAGTAPAAISRRPGTDGPSGPGSSTAHVPVTDVLEMYGPFALPLAFEELVARLRAAYPDAEHVDPVCGCLSLLVTEKGQAQPNQSTGSVMVIMRRSLLCVRFSPRRRTPHLPSSMASRLIHCTRHCTRRCPSHLLSP